MATTERLATELLAEVAAANLNRHFWLGIAGAPGSGKSTLAKQLRKQVGDQLLVIPMDGYHYYRHELDAMPNPTLAHARRGSPFTFNAQKFVSDLQAARKTGKGSFPGFDHGQGDPVEDSISLVCDTKRIVVVEGNYLLLNVPPWNQLKPLFDATWFLDASLEECKRRIYQRHCQVGRSPGVAQERIDSNDGPNAELVIHTCRNQADRLINVDNNK